MYNIVINDKCFESSYSISINNYNQYINRYKLSNDISDLRMAARYVTDMYIQNEFKNMSPEDEKFIIDWIHSIESRYEAEYAQKIAHQAEENARRMKAEAEEKARVEAEEKDPVTIVINVVLSIGLFLYTRTIEQYFFIKTLLCTAAVFVLSVIIVAISSLLLKKEDSYAMATIFLPLLAGGLSIIWSIVGWIYHLLW